jgi:hypothetical protein
VLNSCLDILVLCRSSLLSIWFLVVLERTWFMSAWYTLIESYCTYISWMLLDSSLSLLNAIEGVRIPCLCILSKNTNIILYERTLGSFLISFRSPISLLSLYLVLSIWFFGSFDCFLLPLKFVLLVIYLQSVILNMVWAPPHIHIWIRAYDFTHSMRNAHFGEELVPYLSLNFFIHFGICCQWGRSLEGLREMALFLRLVCS